MYSWENGWVLYPFGELCFPRSKHGRTVIFSVREVSERKLGSPMVKDEIRSVRYLGGGGLRQKRRTWAVPMVTDSTSWRVSSTHLGYEYEFPWRFRGSYHRLIRTPPHLGGERVTHANFDIHFERGHRLRSSTLIPGSRCWPFRLETHSFESQILPLIPQTLMEHLRCQKEWSSASQF